MAWTVIMTVTPKGIVKPVALAKCKRNLFRNKANTGRLDHARLYIVMYVARCKWNQKAEADICSPSQMISRDTRLPTLSSLRVKFSQNSWNMSVLLKNILVIKLWNWTFWLMKMLKSSEATMEENALPTLLLDGVAERLNRTILEAARSILYQAKLSLNFWAEACSIAVYLHNRSPTTALKDGTPFESLFGRRPDISNLRVFGCVSYERIPESQRRKLDAKAHKQSLLDVLLVSRGISCMIWRRSLL